MSVCLSATPAPQSRHNTTQLLVTSTTPQYPAHTPDPATRSRMCPLYTRSLQSSTASLDPNTCRLVQRTRPDSPQTSGSSGVMPSAPMVRILTTPASAITLNRSLMRGHWLTTTRSPGPNRPRLWACRNRHDDSYSTRSSRVRPHGNHDNPSFDPNQIEAGQGETLH